MLISKGEEIQPTARRFIAVISIGIPDSTTDTQAKLTMISFLLPSPKKGITYSPIKLTKIHMPEIKTSLGKVSEASHLLKNAFIANPPEYFLLNINILP